MHPQPRDTVVISHQCILREILKSDWKAISNPRLEVDFAEIERAHLLHRIEREHK